MFHNQRLIRRSPTIGYVDKIYEKLQWMVTTFQIPPSSSLNIGDLSDLLHVSRTPIREALNRLLAEGVIEFRQNYGFYNRPLDIEIIHNSYNLRELIDDNICNLIASSSKEKRLSILSDLDKNQITSYDEHVDEVNSVICHEKILKILIGSFDDKLLSRAYALSLLESRYFYYLYICNQDRKMVAENCINNICESIIDFPEKTSEIFHFYREEQKRSINQVIVEELSKNLRVNKH